MQKLNTHTMKHILTAVMLFSGIAMAQKSTKILSYKSDYLFSDKSVLYVQNDLTHIYCYLANSSDISGGLVLRDSEIDTFYLILKKCLISFRAWNAGGIQPNMCILENSEFFFFDSENQLVSDKTDLIISFKTLDGAKMMVVRIDDFITALKYSEAVSFTNLFSPATISGK